MVVLDQHPDQCPWCGKFLRQLWSGVKCNGKNCGYWFCY
jgi:DNA polymerase II large subunit